MAAPAPVKSQTLLSSLLSGNEALLGSQIDCPVVLLWDGPRAPCTTGGGDGDHLRDTLECRAEGIGKSKGAESRQGAHGYSGVVDSQPFCTGRYS